MLIAALAPTACGGSWDSIAPPGGSALRAGGNAAGAARQTVSVVAYSTARGALGALSAGFAATPAGRHVAFTESFGASGAQSRAVADGQPADVVLFSAATDIRPLVAAGMVSPGWASGPHHGICSQSLVVFLVRRGNPDRIGGWADLLRRGVGVVTPNPESSGSARWNILAAYGAQLVRGRSPAGALAYLRRLLIRHVVDEPVSSSAALEAFLSGEGDVLLDSESDAIAAVRAGDPVQIVYPAQTILIQLPIAVTREAPKAARDFLAYQWSAAAQKLWAREGYRPVLRSVAVRWRSQFPTPTGLFTIGRLGGWATVQRRLFSPTGGAITRIQEDAGVPTAAG